MLTRSVATVSLVVFVFCAAIARDAQATPFQAGDFITHLQDDWGDASTIAGARLSSYFNAIYGALGYAEVGISGAGGFSILVTSASSAFTYLPASGAPGALLADLVDPTSTPAGIFGGEVFALRLNVDFSDAGYTLGSLGIPFGDLVIHDYSQIPQVNGLTVRQVLAGANTLLGGGATGYSIADANSLVMNLNASFDQGPNGFAQNYLRVRDDAAPQPVPEPATLSLLGVGAVALGMRRRSVRHDDLRLHALCDPHDHCAGVGHDEAKLVAMRVDDEIRLCKAPTGNVDSAGAICIQRVRTGKRASSDDAVVTCRHCAR